MQEEGNNTYCRNCGADFNTIKRKCPKCGAQTEGRICATCGHDFAAAGSVGEVVSAVAAKASCKIIGHDYVGCKCTRCGETRDEEHDFRPVKGKCEQKCRVCGEVEELPHQWVDNKCTRCGKTRIEAGKFVHEHRMPISIVVGVVLLLLLAIGIFNLPGSDEAVVPGYASSFVDKNFEDVATQFQVAGFNNIELEPLDDLVFGVLHKEGEVKEVSVDGKTDFLMFSKFK
ncbi:MAG: hypothetical protein LBG81_02240, partial [Coriobacteriaceae bacterium]|nr:hypothetical protein [Coriobacteriaceae bacterium]